MLGCLLVFIIVVPTLLAFAGAPLPLAVVIIGGGALRWWLSKTNRPAPPRDGDDDRHDQRWKD
jgi:hypothetical protein